MEQELKQNIRLRASLKQKLTHLSKYVEAIKTAQPEVRPSLSEVQVKIQNYSNLYNEFEAIQLKIETACDESQLADQYDERDQFDSKFTEIMGFLNDYVNNLQLLQQNVHSNNVQVSSSNGNYVHQSDTHTLQNLLVPKMKISVFKGDYEEWIDFKVSFGSVATSTTLNNRTMREWKAQDLSEFPTINEFVEFLNSKTDQLEDINDQKLDTKKESISKHSTHSNSKDARPMRLSNENRLAAVEKFSLCKNCLKIGHNVDNCRLGPCKICQQKHNSLLHAEAQSNSSNAGREGKPAEQLALVVNPVRLNDDNNHQVLLSTVTFFVQNAKGEKIQCRAILDSGSQVHLVTEKCAKLLQLPLHSANMTVSGINQTISKITKKCLLTIFSKYNEFTTTIACYVVPVISSHTPSQNVIMSEFNIPDHIQLSDNEFNVPRQIDAITGSTLFWDVLIQGKISLGKNCPILQNTKLGWIIAGPTPNSLSTVSCNFMQAIPEDYQLKRFWEVEELSSKDSHLSMDDIECEHHFDTTTVRNDEGRFIVQLPLKYSPNLLGDSLSSATKQFLSLEKRFAKDPSFKEQYSEFIREYSNLGHLSEIKFPIPDAQWYYFLPHHGVVKQESLSTKLRVVFNGSHPSDSGWSLNDLQYVGPKVQNDIFPILLRFRMYTFVVSADIMKMYRQILIHPDHRPLQLILWRDNPNQFLQTLQLNTVTYGTTSAPYLAVKCIKELSKTATNPQVANIIEHDFYVDDLLTGHNDLETIQYLCKSIRDHLASGGFILRKWLSNDNDVLSNVHIDDDPLTILNLSDGQSSKTLGIQWCSQGDFLKYNIAESQPSEFISKRQILSVIAQIYDPLGLLSPTIILAKIMIQKLWCLKLFSTEYVTQLHQSYKWLQGSQEIALGTLVLIQEKNLPPCKWALGRIHKLYPGKDNKVRVADVKTSKGIIRRSIRHLHPLPTNPSIQPFEVPSTPGVC
ncbi:hypothetical protein NQ315_014279 [Exocentrus adspersus]|uniref:DUF5641 domain-containing protein n=1 Tax=Exocentrus adspersus TaxID=1586481 RepID=A0AAV8VIJ5_9CUCU|nr:hypothetical protein NQ315_014279 [Exocentrus adspersus]